METTEFAKQDMTVIYGNRTFAVRAYRQEGDWHGVIIENRTPLRSGLPPATDPASCFAAAVGFIATVVDRAASPAVARR